MIKKYEKDGYVVLVGRVKAVYPVGTYEREDGTVYRYRNMIAVFPTEEGGYRTYKITATGGKMGQFDKFSPGDLVIIRYPKSAFEGDRPPVDEEKGRIYIGRSGTALKGGDIHEEYYKIPKLEELKTSAPRTITTIKKILEDIEKDPEAAKNNWYTIIGNIYRIHAVYPYTNREGKHGLVIRLGIEDHSGAYIRAKTFAYDTLLEDAGINIDDVEKELEKIKEKADENENVNKLLSAVLNKVEGKYYIMTLKVDHDDRINEWTATIIRFEHPDEELIKKFIGGDE